MESQVWKDALDSVNAPIQNFIETGIYTDPFNDPDMPNDMQESGGFITSHQTRRVCRNIARELKRPFITMEPYIHCWEWKPNPATGKYTREKVDRSFSHTTIMVPKQRRLAPIITPLLLIAVPDSDLDHVPVRAYEMATYHRFVIRDEPLWLEYRATMDRPEMRIARRMEPLPE